MTLSTSPAAAAPAPPAPVSGSAADQADDRAARGARPVAAGPDPAAELAQDRQVQLGVLACYLVDALCLAGFAALGLVPGWVPVALGLLGLAVVGSALAALHRPWYLRHRDSTVIVLQTLVANGAMLAIAWVAPAVAALMLFTVIVVFSTAALRLAPRTMLGLGVATAFGAVLVASALGEAMRLPVATAPERLASGVFFVWTLLKGASVNLIGTEWRQRLSASQQQLSEALARVEQLATHDELTGLPNRRHILERLRQEVHRQQRSGQAFGLMVIDLDHFKRINDGFGHATGDAVLRRFAAAARGGLRLHDHVGRLGGEEFLLVLAAPVDRAGLDSIAARLRRQLAGQPWDTVAPGLRPTVSIGATLHRDGDAPEATLERADQLLYRAKQAGRDRMVRD